MANALDKNNIPKSIGIIMDGNGRWAKAQGKPRLFGHTAGMEALHNIVMRAGELGVEYLTVYAFSTENWKRPVEEVNGIFKLLITYVEKELEELNKNNVMVNILGDWSVVSPDVQLSIKKLIGSTAKNTGLRLNIALNYGGRAEIVRAAREIVKSGAAAEDITEELFSSKLYTAGMPDPELIIRTGGEIRISNFLIWQSAYSEFVPMDCYWPDFTTEKFEEAISFYQKRDRRFGGLK